MTRAEEYCRELCAKIAKARDRRCILCRLGVNLEAAHIFPKAQGNWTIIYDTDYIVTLCSSLGNDCHQDMPRGSDLFEKVIARIRVRDPGRAEKILVRANTPITPCTIRFDPKTAKRVLRLQWDQINESAWMDADIDTCYGDPLYQGVING